MTSPDLDADLRDIPAFLMRVGGDVKPQRRPRHKVWRPTPLEKKQAQRDAKKREKIAARPTVYAAVKAGAETFQALRKATGLDPTYIRAALRFYIHNARAIQKDGCRYFVVGWRA